MLRKVMTASLCGIGADLIVVETDLQMGLPAVNIVGLADTTIKEAKERIRTAIINSGYGFPRQRVTVNLSPAGVPKEGSHFDLPIAVGLLGIMDDSIKTDGYGFLGELSLDGQLRHVRGALPLAMKLREAGVRKVIIPAKNADEAALLKDIEIYPADTLKDCVRHLKGEIVIKRYVNQERDKTLENKDFPDFYDVLGQESVKRALVIAAAGNHGILMMGSPGSGKTMMAKRLPYIMPDMTYEEMLEVTGIYSIAGLLGDGDGPVTDRQLRAPHHTISRSALLGGGALPRPGEISLAHNGILFLDEFGEFAPSVIELLRQPLEDGVITINRARTSVEFPCRIMLVAAANPCKCGYYGDGRHICTCTAGQLEKYFAKFSGPMLDRIDMHIRVDPVSAGELSRQPHSASTEEMKQQVEMAVKMQKKRYQGKDIDSNSDLKDAQIKEYCRMTKDAGELMESALVTLGISMRTANSIMKVARTIADIQQEENIQQYHMAEALSYRSLDHLYRRTDDGH